MIIKLTDSNIDQCLENNLKRFMLVDFWTSRCETCRFNSAVADEISKAYESILDIGKVNVEENPYTIARFQVNVVPFMALFHKQKLIHRFSGNISKSAVIDHITSHNRLLEESGCIDVDTCQKAVLSVY